MVAELIGWFFGVMLMSWHMQCSTLAEHGSECVKINISSDMYFKERIQWNESNLHYYEESKVESLQNLLEDNTDVMFCAKVVMQRKVIQIANRTNIALYGRLGGHTEIHCSLSGNESAGYRFRNVTNLTLSNLSFINCGILNPVIDKATQLQGTMPLLSAIWIYSCENVMLTNIKVRNSTGTGIILLDTIGRVEITNSSFETSNFHNEYNIAYGIYVKFSSDYVREDKVYENCSRHCTFVFHNDSFINNSVPSYHNPRVYTLYRTNLNEQFGLGGGLTFHFEDNDSWYTEKVINITNCKFKNNTGHHGGGMTLNFTKSTSGNNVTITQCNFTNNTGDFGGGLSLFFSDSSHNNFVLLSNVEFSKNCAKMGGGAMEFGFHFQQKRRPEPNNVTLRNCRVVENQAHYYGGGTILYYSRTKYGTQNYRIEFINSTWERNTAVFGAAVQASLHVSDKLTSGYTISPVFQDCKFMSNYRIEEKLDKEKLARLSWGKGVFFTTGLPIQFKGNTLFFSSNATALCLSSSIVEFAAGSNVNFTNNTGFEGGAINLYGLSEVHVNDNSSFLFYDNTALSKGGAIMYRSGNKLDLVSSRRCFIRYVGDTTTVDERSITLEFKNNSARALRNNKSYGHTMYATTLIPCRQACKEQGGHNYTAIQLNFGCIGNMIFWDNKTYEVSTDGAVFSLSNESNKMTAIPGKEFELKFKLLDENNEEAYDSYRIATPQSKATSIKLDPTYSFISDKTIKLYGEPGHKGTVIIGINNFRDIAVGLNVEMEQCPPGFVTDQNIKNNSTECACSASVADKRYFGIFQCELHSYQAYLIHGYWIGYDTEKGSEGTLRSAYCPRGFCTRKEADETEILLPIKPSRDAVNDVVCREHRQGKLCGSCSSNMSVYYHSHSYYCWRNDRCGLGPLLYFVSEIIPVTILFMIVLFFNVKLTSGTLNGFIFFIQFIDTMLIDANGFISTHNVLDTFMSIYLFTYRMFNLNFFTIDKFSFCLWQGANTLDIISFKYLTILYSITLVIITVLLKKCGKGKYLVHCRSQNLRGSESSKSSVKSTMIHGFSAFFVMCYSQCAKVTLFILTPGRVHSIGRLYSNTITSVVFYHGDFKYFGDDHIKYAIPALMFAIALVLIPPLLLVVYPLCYKVLALLRIEETRCVNILCRILPLERMKPMFDSFQSCFKDKCRFFAGLYFFYRLVALLSFLITDSLTKFYIALEVQLIVMLTLQAITYPYRRRWHNIIDVLLFANLAVINAMTMYNYKRSKERNLDTRSINAMFTIQTILVSTPFVCMVCFVIIQLALRLKRARKSEGQCRDERTDTVLTLVDYREMEESKSLEY